MYSKVKMSSYNHAGDKGERKQLLLRYKPKIKFH
jgi:hypothetical protein